MLLIGMDPMILGEYHTFGTYLGRILIDFYSNPINWNPRKKWFAMGTVGLMCFVSPFASTLPAPALPQLAVQFGITSSTVAALCISVSVLTWYSTLVSNLTLSIDLHPGLCRWTISSAY